MIRPARSEDARRIAAIYNHYVENTAITFEEEPLSVEEMAHRIVEYSKSLPWLVHEEDGRILGYCYASKWHVRSAFRHSAETTIYVDEDAHGRGIGADLYARLIEQAGAKGVHALMAVVTLPNEKSRRLHEKLGFRKMGQLEEVGHKFGLWHDVGYWEYKYR
jgi:phosphinothricin acetyltransferase